MNIIAEERGAIAEQLTGPEQRELGKVVAQILNASFSISRAGLMRYAERTVFGTIVNWMENPREYPPEEAYPPVAAQAIRLGMTIKEKLEASPEARDLGVRPESVVQRTIETTASEVFEASQMKEHHGSMG